MSFSWRWHKTAHDSVCISSTMSTLCHFSFNFILREKSKSHRNSSTQTSSPATILEMKVWLSLAISRYSRHMSRHPASDKYYKQGTNFTANWCTFRFSVSVSWQIHSVFFFFVRFHHQDLSALLLNVLPWSSIYSSLKMEARRIGEVMPTFLVGHLKRRSTTDSNHIKRLMDYLSTVLKDELRLFFPVISGALLVGYIQGIFHPPWNARAIQKPVFDQNNNHQETGETLWGSRCQICWASRNILCRHVAQICQATLPSQSGLSINHETAFRNLVLGDTTTPRGRLTQREHWCSISWRVFVERYSHDEYNSATFLYHLVLSNQSTNKDWWRQRRIINWRLMKLWNANSYTSCKA